MARPVTLVGGQWADLPFDELCAKVKSFGYDGIELATFGNQINPKKAAQDAGYVKEMKNTLEKYGLKSWAISGHLAGQCVGDEWDPRLDGFAPSEFAGQPEKIREWAIQEMMYIAQAAKNFGIEIVTGFMGSPIWRYWYSFPQTTNKMIDDGFKKIVELWTPIFDEFDKLGLKFALEVHPTEIAYDYYTAERLIKEFKGRKTLGFNFDPSHFIWQGVIPHIFLKDFADRIYHVHMKDTMVSFDGKASVLGSHITFGDTRRAWNFVSLGHGSVDFEKIIRELNAMNYKGPLSVEWEDSGMDREYGAKEACEFVRRINFTPSSIAFDDAIKQK